jgi:hypothetical protein
MTIQMQAPQSVNAISQESVRKRIVTLAAAGARMEFAK